MDIGNPGIFPRDDHVAPEHDALPKTGGITVDPRDNRFLHLGQGLMGADDPVENLPRALGVIVSPQCAGIFVIVRARRHPELAVLCAGQDDDPHILIVTQVTECLTDFPVKIERPAGDNAVGQIVHVNGRGLVTTLDVKCSIFMRHILFSGHRYLSNHATASDMPISCISGLQK